MKFEEILNQIAAYYTPWERALTLLFPVALAVFLIVWFRGAAKHVPLRKETALDWVRRGPPSLNTTPPVGRLKKADIPLMLLITALYAAAAFALPGSLNVPQNYWKVFNSAYSAVDIEFNSPVTVSELWYYTGNFHGEGDGSDKDADPEYTLKYSDDGKNWSEDEIWLHQEYSATFDWHRKKFDAPVTAAHFLLTAGRIPIELGEVVFVAEDGYSVITPDFVSDGTVFSSDSTAAFSGNNARALFDEQETAPLLTGNTPFNSTYFDEIYHARAAYEMLNGIYPYENTHPPLGKEIIALGIKAFGMTPFGWRFPGTLLGVLMLPLLYLLITQLFDKTWISAAATAIWAADFMHLTQTKIATIDTYNVFFVLLMFIFMHRWIAKPNDTPFSRTLPPLILAGLSFGLGFAAKWSCAYAGLGLFALFVWKLYSRAKYDREHGRSSAGFIAGTLSVSLAAFIVVPFWVYLLSYIPYVVNEPLNLRSLWNACYHNQISMFNYHTALKSSHGYAARWYLWLVDARPICYYYSRDGATLMTTVIDAWNNPVLSWGGIFALIMSTYDAFARRSFKALFPVIGWLSVMLPWILVSRITFAYHYFPATIFLVLAFASCFARLEAVVGEAGAKRRAAVMVTVSCVLFALFYPALSGVAVPYDYTRYVLQWFPSWPF